MMFVIQGPARLSREALAPHPSSALNVRSPGATWSSLDCGLMLPSYYCYVS